MPFIGWALGTQFESYITSIDHWIAFILDVYKRQELACERITAEELESLKEACANFAKETKQGNANRLARADVAFHDIILNASGNERLVQMISKLSQQMYRYRLEYVKDETSYERLIAEHEAIYEAICSRDGRAGAEAIKNHIDNQEKAVIRRITKKEIE